MDDHLRWHRRLRMEEAAVALNKNGMPTVLFDGRDEALAYLLAEARQEQRIGFGGSMTIAELALLDHLQKAGKQILNHSQPGLSPEERRQVMQGQLDCDLFFTSTNALTLKGQLVNIDATGNRVGAMFFGPRRVLVVAGANKIANDLDSALARVREHACPPNARRLGFDTPCAHTGKCSDCHSPQRICRITTIIERKPRVTDLRICLINEDLGY
jgi:hypothetical protein